MSKKLNQVLPKKPEFKLNGKTYKIRLLNLNDIAYFEDKYNGIEGLMKIFVSEGNYKEKFSIIYAQLDDKSDFLTQEVEEIDREGNKKTITISGSEMFFRALDLVNISEPLNAFMAAFTASMPELTPEQEKEAKKKQKEILAKM
jgi:hypothetical protein